LKTVKRALALCLCLLCCLTAVPVSAANTATVWVTSADVQAGDTVTVDVQISRAENVASVEVHLGYDPTVLRCVSAEMSDTVKSISLSNVNTEPKGHPDEVWLTAVGTTPVVLEGMVMRVTFEVLGTAKAGLSPLTLRKVTVLDTAIKEFAVTTKDGGVTVAGEAVDEPSQTTANTTTAAVATTTAPTVTTTAATVKDEPPAASTTLQGIDPVVTTQPVATDAPDSTPTAISPGGETVALPEQTVVDIAGSVVTDASGEPTRVHTVAVMLGNAVAKPEETVTVAVSLSAVSKLSALGISVHYDTAALQFEGGECVGFVKNSAGMTSVTEQQSGVVEIAATAADMSGSGEIAVLRFKVKANAKNGEYRMAVKGNPLLQAGTMELPVKSVAGKITVEGGRDGGNPTVYVIGAVVLAVIVVSGIFAAASRKRNATSEKPSGTVDVSGENDE